MEIYGNPFSFWEEMYKILVKLNFENYKYLQIENWGELIWFGLIWFVLIWFGFLYKIFEPN